MAKRMKDKPRSRAKKKKKEAEPRIPTPGECAAQPEKRAGLPKPESIREEKQFISPGGKKYRILTTDEVDEYEEKEKTG